MKTVAIVLAGGLGARMGGEKPKQFLEIADKPIVIHSLEAFEQHPNVDEMILVVNANFQKEFEHLLAKYSFSKLKAITVGGKERSDSSKNALSLMKTTYKAKVLIHDAVRPFVSQRIIYDVIKALDVYEAVNVGVSATDTILMVNDSKEVVSMPARKDIYRAQTPQGFHSDIIIKAYEKAAQDPQFTATDDCGVVHRYLPDVAIGVVDGEEENKKITFPSDL